LSAIFLVSFLSATLLPLGSEPAVFAYVSLAPALFWAAVLVGTAGNTLGGIVSYWMGWWAHRGVDRWRENHPPPTPPSHGKWHRQRRTSHAAPSACCPPEEGTSRFGNGPAARKAHQLVERFGARILLLSWLPLVGDPLCAVAGWLRIDFWPSVMYMAIGKLLRYSAMTAFLVWVFPNN